jgi:hypothetical protein
MVRASACRQKAEASQTLSIDHIDPVRMHNRYEVPPTTRLARAVMLSVAKQLRVQPIAAPSVMSPSANLVQSDLDRQERLDPVRG